MTIGTFALSELPEGAFAAGDVAGERAAESGQRAPGEQRRR